MKVLLKYLIYGPIGPFLFWVWLLIVWSAVWKAIALWKAGTRKHLVWFIVLFIVNTAGILEILYIFIFADKGKKKLLKRKAQKRKKR